MWPKEIAMPSSGQCDYLTLVKWSGFDLSKEATFGRGVAGVGVGVGGSQMSGIILTFVYRTPCNLELVIYLETVDAKSMLWFVMREAEVSVGEGLRITGFPPLV